MDALWALGGILGILGVVLVGGYMLAVLVNMISGAFSNTGRTNKKNTEVLDYSEYKLLEQSNDLVEDKQTENSFDQTKALEEEKALKSQSEAKDDFKFESFADDGDLEEIENRLKSEKVTGEAEETKSVVENNDDEDIDSLLEDISNDVINDTRDEIIEQDAETLQPDSSLDNYSIDEILENMSNATEQEVEEQTESTEEDATVEGETAVTNDVEQNVENIDTVDNEKDALVTEGENNEDDLARQRELDELKRQIEELNRQLELARSNVEPTEIVIDMTEEQCLGKIAVVEERLKNLRKDYKINLKEYKPLRKVRENLEKYQTKLRRREAVAAKKKVALYGVNNYVDIDKDKAEKLANELELLDGLRLSVQHCEEVIESSKDRYPILENTNNILEEQIANTEADLAELQLKLEKIRERQGK